MLLLLGAKVANLIRAFSDKGYLTQAYHLINFQRLEEISVDIQPARAFIRNCIDEPVPCVTSVTDQNVDMQ